MKYFWKNYYEKEKQFLYASIIILLNKVICSALNLYEHTFSPFMSTGKDNRLE